MLTAVRNQWELQTFNQDGTGVMNWRRESHGRRSAATLDQEGNMTFHRDLPEWVRAPAQENRRR